MASAEQTSPAVPLERPCVLPPLLTPSVKEQHYEHIAGLRASGLSIRAIAAAVGCSRTTVDRWLLRGPPRQRGSYPSRRAPPRQALPAAVRRLSPKQGAWLLVSEAKDLDGKQQARLKQWLEQQPDLEPLYRLAQRFVQIVKQGQAQQLAEWIAQAQRPLDLKEFNERVYAQLFLTPSDDPWLGLAPAERAPHRRPVPIGPRGLHDDASQMGVAPSW